MQLIKRLKSLALAAIALAFAQTALAATFPGTPVDPEWTSAADGDYYTDGSGNKYQFTTWKNLLKAVGWDVDGNKKVTDSITPGGTAGDPLVVKIYNYTNVVSKLGCEIIDNDLGCLSHGKYEIGYVTYEFHDCYFKRESESDLYGAMPKRWGAYNSSKDGIKIKFFDCDFGDRTDNSGNAGCRLLYCMVNDSYEKKYPDFEFISCNIRKFDGVAGGIRLFAGSTCGDLVVSNCVLDCYINAQVKGYNSMGTKPTMIVKDCFIDQRVNNIGVPIGAENCGFARYEVSGFRDMSGNAMQMMFYKSTAAIEGGFGNGRVLADDGSESTDGKSLTACVCEESRMTGYTYFEFAIPARLVYDVNEGTGTYPLMSEDGCDYRDVDHSFTVVSPEDSNFSKNGFAVGGWNTQTDGKGTAPIGGTIKKGSIEKSNLVLYAIYGNTPKQTGWYTITGIHKVDQNKEGGCSLDDIKTIWYPWYSGIHYITNVYDRVTATYAGGDLPTDDDAHPEVSWANCGGIITLNDGSTYTNQLQVKIFPKTGTTGEQLRIDTSDYIPETPRATHNLHLYYASKTDAKYAKFVFENCYMAHNAKVDNSFKSEIPLDWSGCCGVAFAMRHCTAECGFYVLRASTMLAEHHPVDLEYSSVTFICEDDIDNWHLNAGLWNGDFLMTNCFFDAKVRVSTQHCGDGQDMGIYEGGSGQTLWEVSLCDSFGGTTECVISNNTWRYVMPGYRIFSINRPWNQYIGENTYSPEGGAARPITMDVKDNGGDDDRKKNVTSDTMSSGDTPSSGLYYFKYFVHGHEVKFVETDDESKLDDPEVAKTTYYVLDGDSLNEANFWSKENWDDNSEKTVDLTRRNRSVPEGDWNNAVTGKSLSEDLGTTVKKDITYFLGAVTPKNPELVGTLKMSSFVKGHEPTTPSGLSWRVGENGTLYPLLVGSGESPLASECEYYIFSNPNTTEGGIPATLENLKKLEATGKGTDYYIRGIVTDFSEEPDVKEHAPLVSAPAKFTVVNPEYSEYDDFMFVDWIESTDCQYLDTLIDPAQNGDWNFGLEIDFKDDCFIYDPVSRAYNDGFILGSAESGGPDWRGFVFKNYPYNSTLADDGASYGGPALGQWNFCQEIGWWSYTQWYENPHLRSDVRLQISFKQYRYSISSCEDCGWGFEFMSRGTYPSKEPPITDMGFAGSVYLAALHNKNIKGDYVAAGYKSEPGWANSHNMHFYGLRFYNGTELIYEGIPAIEKSTGHRGLLRINGDKGDKFIYSATYTNGMDIVTKTAEKHDKYVANLGEKVTGPLGLNEFNAPLLDFETHLAQECGCFEVSAPSDKVAVTLEKQIKDRLWDYAVEETPGAQFIGTQGMTNAVITVLYATKGLAKEQDWTNTVVNANLADPTTATLGNGSLQLFDDNNWSAKPPEGTDEFKVVVLTAVSKPVVRTVTVTRGITVTLDANGGKYEDEKETATLVAMPDEPMAELTDDQIPTKAGNTFIGYYDAKEGGTKYYNVDGTSAKNCDLADGATLYAHWLDDAYELLPYLDNGDKTNLAGYVELEGLHLAGTNVVEVKYSFNKKIAGWEHLFMVRQASGSGVEFSEYGLLWSNNPAAPETAKGLVLGYGVSKSDNTTTAAVSHMIDNEGCFDENKDVVLRVVPGEGEEYVAGTFNGEALSLDLNASGKSFDHTLTNNILIFTADSAKNCDGVPETYANGLMNVAALAKIYYFSVEASADDPTLLIELVPVKRMSDGQRGFWDMVGEKFYPLKHPILLDGNGGEPAERYVYAARGEDFPEVEPPTWPGHVFLGYYSNKTDSASVKFYDADGKSAAPCPFAEATNATLRADEQNTIYAHWRLEKPVELLITAHAHTADADSKQYVYLAVQPSFATALTDDAFSTWLNEAKDGKAFKVCVSDDGETFNTATDLATVTLEENGEHKYDADVANGWVWMKVDISAAKDAGKKYWKAMFVTPAPESAD